jgi:hypothetical protein
MVHYLQLENYALLRTLYVSCTAIEGKGKTGLPKIHHLIAFTILSA